MHRDFVLVNGSLTPTQPGQPVIWTDLISPDRAEEAALEDLLGIDLPTRADMVEIESSSRIYSEAGALFLTATLPAQTDSDLPVSGPVSFVLAPDRLVTIRYHSPRVIDEFPKTADRTRADFDAPAGLLLALLEAIVDQMADILEGEGRRLDEIAREIFAHGAKSRRKQGQLQTVIGRIGRIGELGTIIQDSLQSLDRVVGHLAQYPLGQVKKGNLRDQAKTLARDLKSLMDYANALTQRTTFLLEATLGMVGLEQNEIIKFFAVVSVVFLPPTLVGTIYGMNFQHMPELTQAWGYPVTLGVMAFSALAPYVWFKWKGWF